MSRSAVKYSKEFHVHFELFREAQEIGFAFLYRKLFPNFLYMAQRMVKEDIAATSIAQEGFLRLWQCRVNIKDLGHLNDFLHDQIKQAVYRYYRLPSTRFYRGLIQIDGIENAADHFMIDPGSVDRQENGQAVTEAANMERERQRAQLFAVLPGLPGSQKQVIDLLLRHGFDYERIAWHLGGVSCYVAAKRIESTIALLKSILISGAVVSDGQVIRKQVVLTGGLTEEQANILRYRYELSYSFAEIAKLMNIQQADIQRAFVIAHQQMRKEKAA
ncbi:sigma-70 family RNA polymerase sigma factor [Mucilaginibacter daejeonensis]|uniref:sigma-70 family RNA polymerase sigma factor n=1 Tax=Mucilaginibacter daejeonensis TaxID=398049 RepID=UPI001D17C9C2|nr:sigma-70 family RNA polymerase sigma factor [Mucilaginibacter daejeonensis]UEG54882.1 sigma-70 family RNA polymerase sigma factor [Mucilaginibacter daejeonensis]